MCIVKIEMVHLFFLHISNQVNNVSADYPTQYLHISMSVSANVFIKESFKSDYIYFLSLSF